MIQVGASSLGKLMQDAASVRFTADAETLVVTRSTTGATQNLSCLPQPLNMGNASWLLQEGSLNIQDARPTRFVFQSGADVREAVDMVAWNGSNYRIVNVVTDRLSGVTVGVSAYGIREAA